MQYTILQLESNHQNNFNIQIKTLQNLQLLNYMKSYRNNLNNLELELNNVNIHEVHQPDNNLQYTNKNHSLKFYYHLHYILYSHMVKYNPDKNYYIINKYIMLYFHNDNLHTYLDIHLMYD